MDELDTDVWGIGIERERERGYTRSHDGRSSRSDGGGGLIELRQMGKKGWIFR